MPRKGHKHHRAKPNAPRPATLGSGMLRFPPGAIPLLDVKKKPVGYIDWAASRARQVQNRLAAAIEEQNALARKASEKVLAESQSESKHVRFKDLPAGNDSFTIGEAAKFFGVSVGTIRRWTDEDDNPLECHRVGHGHRRFSRKALTSYKPTTKGEQ